MDQPTVLIISDDPYFPVVITSRWQSERKMPAFTMMSSDVCLDFDPENFQLAIAGRIRPQALAVVMEAMDAAGKRVLFVSDDARAIQSVRDCWPGVVVVRQQENWLEMVVLVATEVLHRAAAEFHARRAEQQNALLERQATLGRYMLEMQHTLNNTLTSMLGNSELLLVEPGSLSAAARAQIETVRNMALRMHEILQRFSSLEKELRVVERQSGNETKISAHAAAV